MNVIKFVVGPLQTNSYLVVCEKTHKSVLVDPGGVSQQLMNRIEEYPPEAVLLTHGHFDHIAAVDDIVGIADIPVRIHELDAAMLTDSGLNGAFMIGGSLTVSSPYKLISGGDIVSFGESALTVFHTPGHSPGGVSLVSDGEFVLGGDMLFQMSVGRWDLPGGDYGMLRQSLEDTFMPMEDQVIVYPGHGETTTIGFEKQHNQFMQK